MTAHEPRHRLIPGRGRDEAQTANDPGATHDGMNVARSEYSTRARYDDRPARYDDLPPEPRPRGSRVVIERESAGMTTLRAITYVLCSLAALVFLAVVIYGYLQLREVGAALEQLGSFPGPTPAPFELPQTPPVEPPTIGG